MAGGLVNILGYWCGLTGVLLLCFKCGWGLIGILSGLCVSMYSNYPSTSLGTGLTVVIAIELAGYISTIDWKKEVEKVSKRIAEGLD